MVLLPLGLTVVEQRCLRVMVGKLLRLTTHFVVGDGFWKRHEAGLSRLKRASTAEGVRFVRHATAGDRLTVHAVALVIVHWRDRGVDRDFWKFGATEPRNLRVGIRVNAAGQQWIIREVDTGYDMRGAKGDLLRLGKEVVWVAIQDHPTNWPHWDKLLRNDLGRIENVEREPITLFRGEDLQSQLPLRVRARLDRFPEVAAMKIGIRASDLHGLVPDEGVRPLLWCPVEFYEDRLAVSVDEAVRMHAEPLHHPEASGDGSVGHGPHHHV